MQARPFVLFCAGEDSGDVLGETLVRPAVESGMNVLGVGGPRMQRAGLVPVGDYETLPVSGFGDVLPRVFRLKKIFSHLESLLREDSCVALVCIDYPGFNMKLCRRALALKKPVLYVAPPQVWAWKKHRARRLRGAKLAVLFNFERRVYESLGLGAEILEHPFLRAVGACAISPNSQAISPKVRETRPNDSDAREARPNGLDARETRPNQDVVVLPGSRESQALRNLPFFMEVVSRVHALHPERNFVLVASRESLKTQFECAAAKLSPAGSVPAWLRIDVAPQEARERATFYARHAAALCMPGSATLELALSGVPLVVADVLDPLTYFIGKHFVKTDYFALPNVLLGRSAYPEFFFTRGASRKKDNAERVAEALRKALENPPRSTVADLVKTFAASTSAESLMTEFLCEFVERDTH
jgi:lipid-A-disaccharide synthase